MNETIQLLQNRRSTRVFNEQPIEKEVLDEILKAAQQAPNSINAQQTSLIVIQDKETLQKIEEVCGGFAKVARAQAFIVIAMDFHKTEVAIQAQGEEQEIHNHLEGLLVGAVDAGIMSEAISVAAESFGIGSTIIGAIRNQPQFMIDLCQLPTHTYPLIGVMLGYPEGELGNPKIRLPKETFIHQETYQSEGMLEAIQTYDAQLDEYNEARNLSHLPNYSQQVTALYSQKNKRQNAVRSTLEGQGFSFH